jgi:hypothetical protein
VGKAVTGKAARLDCAASRGDSSSSSSSSSDSGASSFDESGFVGAFAKGGSFTIGGDGGTDTTPVKFWGTKGEMVTVTQPGVAPPSSINVPSSISVPSQMLNPAASDTPSAP